ncbi:hybrid sensor histidine kinase/response regulator [Halobacteriales archaeon QH_6_64_20]|nr:MAG: hybrid sensor histidine kinase/response regulator [Halobacteriales archaeon QH_6_64_20]
MSVAHHESVRVLHADSEPDFADLAAMHLEREREAFDVCTATSATEGLDRLAREDVDCIVSDYDMPGMDGLDFLEAVREEYPDLPFILFTGRGSEEIASEAISAGVTEYLNKGTGTDQYTVLANRIDNAVEEYRAERELIETDQVVRTILDSLPLVLYTLDEEGRFTRSRGKALETIGLEPGEVVGRSVHEVFGDFPEIIEHCERAFDGELVEEVVEVGDTVFRSWYQPLRDEDGDVVGVVGLSTDVTERERREDELEWKTAALDNAPIGITMTDPAQEDNPLVFVNEHFCAQTGYTEEEVLGRNCRLLQGEETDPEPVARLREGIEAKEPVTTELRNYRKDGTAFWNELLIAPISLGDGRGERYVGFQRDVTERVNRKRELKRQNQRLDEFASIVAHDLRNPLSVARGRLEMGRETGDDEHFEAIAGAHDRMNQLIEDILTLAQEGRTVIEADECLLAAVAGRAWSLVETGDATLEFEGVTRITASEGRLCELFENLFRNAIEHGGEDVSVRVGPLDDSGFYVADDGLGIPPDDREEVFETDYTTADEGTGFGLAIVTQIADAHDWETRVTESDEGGARFEFATPGPS